MSGLTLPECCMNLGFHRFGYLQEFKGCFKHQLTVSGNIETHSSSALETFLQGVITPFQHWAPEFEPLFFADMANVFGRNTLEAFGGCALFFHQKVRSILQTMQTLLKLLLLLKVNCSNHRRPRILRNHCRLSKLLCCQERLRPWFLLLWQICRRNSHGEFLGVVSHNLMNNALVLLQLAWGFWSTWNPGFIANPSLAEETGISLRASFEISGMTSLPWLKAILKNAITNTLTKPLSWTYPLVLLNGKGKGMLLSSQLKSWAEPLPLCSIHFPVNRLKVLQWPLRCNVLQKLWTTGSCLNWLVGSPISLASLIAFENSL